MPVSNMTLDKVIGPGLVLPSMKGGTFILFLPLSWEGWEQIQDRTLCDGRAFERKMLSQWWVICAFLMAHLLHNEKGSL